jgi:hypothetical protein
MRIELADQLKHGYLIERELDETRSLQFTPQG